ncbi:hypothetical protein BASA83_001612 [Batrachochytrium salamandrivorans]|nr:hypothetical protein BASA83_001612 [Batrachochytrium salamandrivorans]
MQRIPNAPLLRNKARLRRLVLFLVIVCGFCWLMVTGPAILRLASRKGEFSVDPIDSTTSSPKASNENKLSDSETMQLLRLELAEHDKAFPWLKAGHKFATVRQLAQSFKGRGIVMTTGKWHFKYARHAITVVRNLGSTLPIQMFYVGDNDLPKESRDELEAISGVVTINLESYFDSHGPDISGWAVKPFSMLASSFEEIIFLDADALFFQPPEVIFNSAAYNDTGAVFYMDRTLYGGREPTLSWHNVQSISWGQESYWIAHEALKMPYRWAPGGGGTVGFIVDPVNHPTKVCGGLYHPDENWKPLWFNGGILRNKHTTDGKVTLSLTHWVTDRTFNEPKWIGKRPRCPFAFHPMMQILSW